MSMRVFNNSVGKWCRYTHEDKEATGIVFYGGQDKYATESDYRSCVVWTPDYDGLTEVDWPDVKALGPVVKPPRF